MGRFFTWWRARVGITQLQEDVTGLIASQAALALQVEQLRVAVADLREQLDLDPMVEAILEDFRPPMGDPQLGS